MCQSCHHYITICDLLPFARQDHRDVMRKKGICTKMQYGPPVVRLVTFSYVWHSHRVAPLTPISRMPLRQVMCLQLQTPAIQLVNVERRDDMPTDLTPKGRRNENDKPLEMQSVCPKLLSRVYTMCFVLSPFSPHRRRPLSAEGTAYLLHDTAGRWKRGPERGRSKSRYV